MRTRGLLVSRLLLPIALALAGGTGCGDDSGGVAGTGGAGTGADAGGAGAGGAGTGGAGAGGAGTGGTGGVITKAECVEMSYQSIPPACLDCACETNAKVTVECGADCWALLLCVGQYCAGDVSDLQCIGANCGDFQSGAASAMAMVASAIILACADICVAQDSDGGTEDAGN